MEELLLKILVAGKAIEAAFFLVGVILVICLRIALMLKTRKRKSRKNN